MSRLAGKLILCLFLSGLFGSSALAHVTPERWVPGPTEKFSQRSPLNLPVIGGFIFLLVGAAVAFFSAWWKKKRGQAPEINFFGIFGSEESEDRRLQILKKERQKTPPSL